MSRRSERYLTLPAMLDAIIALPVGAGERWFCKDLLHLDVESLRVECLRLKMRLALDPRPDWWFAYRLRCVEALLRGSPVAW